MYNQISQLIRNRASTNLAVRPVEYPPPPHMALVASIVGKCQYAVMAALFFADHLLPPGFRESKAMTFFGVMFGGSMISSGLTKTDAFEIYLGRKLVWSTLKRQRQPRMNDLVRGFQKAGVELDVYEQNERHRR